MASAVDPPKAEKRPFEVKGPEGTTPRIDNYYWLRDDKREDQDVLDLLTAENTYADSRLAPLEELKNNLFQEMKATIKEEDMDPPVKRGDYFYYAKTLKGQQYKMFCRRKILEENFTLTIHSTLQNTKCADEEIICDVNKLAEGNDYCNVGGYWGVVFVSPNHKLLAWCVDYSGSEEYTVQVKNLETGEMVEEALATDACATVVWARDNKTLYYTVNDEAKRPYQVYRRTIGETESVLVYEETNEKFEIDLEDSKSGEYIYIEVHSAETMEWFMLDSHDITKAPVSVLPRKHGVRYYVADREGYMYVVSNEDAPNGKVLSFKISEGWEKAIVQIPHDPAVKIHMPIAYKSFVALTMRRQALSVVEVHLVDENGGLKDGVAVPTGDLEIYDVRPRSMEYKGDLLRYAYQTPITPTITYDYNVNTQERAQKKQLPCLGFESSNYAVERRWATASDGTKIPLSLAYRKDTKMKPKEKDAKAKIGNPVYLTGYGSYEVCIEPFFESQWVPYLDRGIVCVIAHIRGGGELGRPWYLDGKYHKKMNTFTDFISSAQYLIHEGYTTADRIAIEGRSAGGLLMGATLNLAGNTICGAAVAGVPFVDSLTTMLDETIPLTVQEYEEWGNPNQVDYYNTMLKYAPVDNVNTKVTYPAIFVSAGLNDPRVGYWEPAKWAQKLREVGQAKDVVFKCEFGSGHFSKSGRFDVLEEKAVEMAFIIHHITA